MSSNHTTTLFRSFTISRGRTWCARLSRHKSAHTIRQDVSPFAWLLALTSSGWWMCCTNLDRRDFVDKHRASHFNPPGKSLMRCARGLLYCSMWTHLVAMLLIWWLFVFVFWLIGWEMADDGKDTLLSNSSETLDRLQYNWDLLTHQTHTLAKYCYRESWLFENNVALKCGEQKKYTAITNASQRASGPHIF